MKTLNEEIARIKSEVADIASKAFTGKTIQERVAEITPQPITKGLTKYP